LATPLIPPDLLLAPPALRAPVEHTKISSLPLETGHDETLPIRHRGDRQAADRGGESHQSHDERGGWARDTGHVILLAEPTCTTRLNALAE
jgi:hypothetical protein